MSLFSLEKYKSNDPSSIKIFKDNSDFKGPSFTYFLCNCKSKKVCEQQKQKKKLHGLGTCSVIAGSCEPHLRSEPICNYLCRGANEMFLFPVNQYDG